MFPSRENKASRADAGMFQRFDTGLVFHLLSKPPGVVFQREALLVPVGLLWNVCGVFPLHQRYLQENMKSNVFLLRAL